MGVMISRTVKKQTFYSHTAKDSFALLRRLELRFEDTEPRVNGPRRTRGPAGS